MADIDINLVARFGDTCVPYRISQVMGSGSNLHFHIYRVDAPGRYWFEGSFFKRRGDWVAPEHFTSDDISIIGEIVDAAMAAQTGNK